LADRTWQWQLPSGEALIARFDPTSHVESIWLGPRLVSRSGQGGKREGHAVILTPTAVPAAQPYRGPHEAVVLFDADGKACSLRIEGMDLPPVRTPGALDAASRSPNVSPSVQGQGWTLGRVVGAGVGVLVGVLLSRAIFVAVVHRRENVVVNTTISATHPSPNGLFVAHYPAAFTPVVQPGLPEGTFMLRHPSKDEHVAICAFPNAVPDDPWKLQQIVQRDGVAGLLRTGATYEETERRDETCAGKNGAVVIGKVTAKGTTGKMWSCTFVHGGHPYWLMYLIDDRDAQADEAMLRRIVDATELTEAPAAPGRVGLAAVPSGVPPAIVAPRP
jgi:hypothetical protein